MSDEKTLAKRRERLARGCCPIHGREFGQVSGVLIKVKRVDHQLGECCRRDCNILALLGPGRESGMLLAPWAYLCDTRKAESTEEERAAMYARVTKAANIIDTDVIDRAMETDSDPETTRCDGIEGLLALADSIRKA